MDGRNLLLMTSRPIVGELFEKSPKHVSDRKTVRPSPFQKLTAYDTSVVFQTTPNGFADARAARSGNR